MLAHLYEQQQLLELQIQGIQKQREELTTLNEELKKTKAQESMFSVSEGKDIEGEYVDLIPALDLTTSSNLNLRTEVRSSSAIEVKIPQESTKPIYGTNISQPVFMPSPSLEAATTSDQPKSKHGGAKSGDTVPLDLSSPQSPAF